MTYTFARITIFVLTLGLSLGELGCTQPLVPARVNNTNIWVRTELYFGLTMPSGPISDAEWTDFLNTSVIPRFPDGLTVISADGRYRSHDQRLHEEPTRVLIILYPFSSAAEADRKIVELASEYISRFKQESVLRDDSQVAADFIEASAGRVTGMQNHSLSR